MAPSIYEYSVTRNRAEELKAWEGLRTGGSRPLPIAIGPGAFVCERVCVRSVHAADALLVPVRVYV